LAGITDPGYNDEVHRHLRRPHRIWIDHPIYFVTTCTFRRRRILVSESVAAILVDEWSAARGRHGWAVGRYVIMPDHVHFFCSAELDAKPLPAFMQSVVEAVDQQTNGARTRDLRSRLAAGILRPRFALERELQPKWEYVRENPDRAGLAADDDHWPWQGEVENLML
jgi:hypothetical protein